MNRLRVGATLALMVAALPGIAPARAEPTPPYPVSYNYLQSSIAAGMDYGAEPPGANDWHCKPSKRNPRPVILVHGLAENRNNNWQTYAPLLANHGFCAFALTYGVTPNAGQGLDQLGGMRRLEDSAVELAKFVRRVRKATGARRVDLVGHSEGTLVSGYYVKFLKGAPRVRHLVSLAPLWHGSTGQTDTVRELLASTVGINTGEGELPLCSSCSQLSPHAPFMMKLRSGGVRVRGVRYLNIVTQYDEVVIPYTSGIEPGMTNVVLQDHCDKDFADHLQIAASPTASVVVLDALQPKVHHEVPCEVGLPAVGGV